MVSMSSQIAKNLLQAKLTEGFIARVYGIRARDVPSLIVQSDLLQPNVSQQSLSYLAF